eukprot:TRINITY_DN1949_c0_g1_i2.p2 TRINITY_DN1949_c0_g1~~TRINITY_DN1949_c0_g1_i2.p2  ORF type:complete len:312 (-),score=85.53 TRINITY_DN1949_c0_g1_i2:296-1201(-)
MTGIADAVWNRIHRKVHWLSTQGNPYLADIGAALCAAFCVSPLVTMVDKAVMENASGRANLWVSMGGTLKTMVFRPHRFVLRPEFLLVTSVYFITYGTANTVDTSAKRRAERRARLERRAAADPTVPLPPPSLLGSRVSPAVVQLAMTTAANMSASMARDSILARMFGSGPPRPFPLACYGAFMCRDTITIAAGFTIPAPLAVYLQQHTSLSQRTCEISSQLLCPVCVQVVSTPIHLLGLDCYNRPSKTVADRTRFILDQARTVIFVRMGRMLPAFGLGGLGNKYFRGVFKAALGPGPEPG